VTAVAEEQWYGEVDEKEPPPPTLSPVQSPLLAHLEPYQSEGPFERPGLLRRVLPFALVTAVAEASLSLSSSLVVLGYALASAALLLGVAAALFLPWSRLPSWLTVAVPVVDVAFVLTLILGTGSASSGVGIIILVPLVWSTLHHRRWESLVVVAGIVVVEIITGLTPVRVSDAALLRRIVFWTALGLLISIATHALRDRLQRSLDQRETSLQQTVAFADASEKLTRLLDPEDVLAVAVQLAAELVAPAGATGRRAQYNHLEGEMMRVVAQFDETGQAVTQPFPWAELPNMVEVLTTGRTTQLPLDPERCGPTVRALVESLEVTNSVYIPLHYAGKIDGVLSVPMRGGAIAPEHLDYCSAFGNLVDLALENAYVHRALEEQAITDNLTGLPNQRAFGQLITNPPGRMDVAILVIDLDGLKRVNDTLGHRAGDEMLVYAAHAMQSALRHGDVVARTGGTNLPPSSSGPARPGPCWWVSASWPTWPRSRLAH
jgi:hypothetical protein